MQNIIKQMEDISFKIDNYNKTINKIKNILGDDYKDYINYLLTYGVYYEKEKTSIFDKMVISVATYYNGWFDTYNLSDSFKYNSKKQIFTYSELRRILINDYITEYGSCYSTGILNEEQLLDLIIKIIENKIINIHRFSLDIYDSIHNGFSPNDNLNNLLNRQNENDRLCTVLKLLQDNTEDLNNFQNVLFKLFLLKGNYQNNNIQDRIINLKEEDKSKLDILISVLKVYTITPEQIDFMEHIFNPIIVNDIKNSLNNFELINTLEDTNTKVLRK